jgi:PilZ domain-containing protein/GAF domain-containing protein
MQMARKEGKDRRANIRLQRVLAVEIKCHGEFFPTVAVDISVSGFQVASSVAPEEGELVKVRIYLRNGPSLQATAELVWGQALELGLHRLGFQFTEMSSRDDFERLCQYVEKENLNSDGIPDDCEETLELATQVTLRSFTDDEIERSTVLAQISEYLNGCFLAGEVLECALKVTVEATGAERGVVLLEQGKEFKVAAFHTLSNESKQDFSHSVAEAVRDDGVPIISLDAQVDDRFSLSNSLKVMGTRSVMCLPIRAKERSFGIMYLDCSVRSGVFTETELRLADVIVGMAASAVERAELFAARAQQEKLAALSTVMTNVLKELEIPISKLADLSHGLPEGQDDKKLLQSIKRETARCQSMLRDMLEKSTAEPRPKS